MERNEFIYLEPDETISLLKPIVEQPRCYSRMHEPAKTERCKVVGFRPANVAVLQNATGPFATSTDLCGGESRKIS